MAAAFSLAATAAGMHQLISATIESTRELTIWSQRLGIGISQMNQWSRVARTFGGDMDDITDVMRELQLKARDAMTGTQSMIDAFELIGITVDDLRPIVDDQTALMDLFTDALNRNTSAATQNFVVDELLSDAGTRLLPMFRAGREELRRLRGEADRMSGRTMAALSKRTADYLRAQRRLNRTWQDARDALVLRLLPAVIRFVERLADFVQAMRDASEQTRIFEGIAIAAILAIVATLLSTIGVWGLWALGAVAVLIPLALIALLIDDILVAAEGGKSVFRELGLVAGDAVTSVLSSSRFLIHVWSRINQAVAEVLTAFRLLQAFVASGELTRSLMRVLEPVFTLVRLIKSVVQLMASPFTRSTARSGMRGPSPVESIGSAARGGFGMATSAIFGGRLPRLGIPGIAGGGQQNQASIMQSPQAQLRRMEVNAPATVTVNVEQAQDPEATAQAVDGRIRTALQRQFRQVAAALIPGAS